VEQNPFNSQQMKKLWERYDHNNNQILEREEAMEFFGDVYDYVTSSQPDVWTDPKDTTIKKWCEHFDKDGDGKISWEGFEAVAQLFVRAPDVGATKRPKRRTSLFDRVAERVNTTVSAITLAANEQFDKINQTIEGQQQEYKRLVAEEKNKRFTSPNLRRIQSLPQMQTLSEEGSERESKDVGTSLPAVSEPTEIERMDQIQLNIDLETERAKVEELEEKVKRLKSKQEQQTNLILRLHTELQAEREKSSSLLKELKEVEKRLAIETENNKNKKIEKISENEEIEKENDEQ
jgi:gas vesicle protein